MKTIKQLEQEIEELKKEMQKDLMTDIQSLIELERLQEILKQTIAIKEMIEDIFNENRKASLVFGDKQDPLRLKVLHLCNCIEKEILTKINGGEE